MLVVALAVSDLLMINTQAPPVWINIFLGKYWAFGPTMCKIYAFAGGVFGETKLKVDYNFCGILILVMKAMRLCG